MVVDLDPKAADQLLCLFAVNHPLIQIPVIEGIQVLIKMPRVHGIPPVELGDRSQMNEPVHLDGFP